MRRSLSLVGTMFLLGCGSSGSANKTTDSSTTDTTMGESASDSAHDGVAIEAAGDSATTSDSTADTMESTVADATDAASADGSVLQHHNSIGRQGLYIEPTITKTAAAAMALSTTFTPTIVGNVYAQPLYVANGPGGVGTYYVVTESNNVYAINATTGATTWTKNIGATAGATGAGCGNISPLGITGTPAIDLPSRTMFFDAVIGNATTILRHEIHAVSIDDGTEVTGWPVNPTGMTSGGTTFNPVVQNERSAVLLEGGIAYVSYGGHAGDCGQYHGWLIGVPMTNPAGVVAWATSVKAGGIWAVGGPASDGTDVFVATGNTYDIGEVLTAADPWGQGDAILRFHGLPAFSGNTMDYFMPSNWQTLDTSDDDLGGSGPLMVDVPGATPSALVMALGKNGVAYLLDRANLGGQGTGNGTTGEGLASNKVASNTIMNAATTYTTTMGTYVVFNTTGTGVGCPTGQSGNMVALRIAAANPPTFTVAWCANNQGRGSPMTTTTDGTNNTVVWAVGATNSNQLHGFDGDTGAVIFAGGGTADTIANVQYFNTPIAVNGNIVAAANNALYMFSSP